MKDKSLIYHILKRIDPDWRMYSPKNKTVEEMNMQFVIILNANERLKKILKGEKRRYAKTKNEQKET